MASSPSLSQAKLRFISPLFYSGVQTILSPSLQGPCYFFLVWPRSRAPKQFYLYCQKSLSGSESHVKIEGLFFNSAVIEVLWKALQWSKNIVFTKNSACNLFVISIFWFYVSLKHFLNKAWTLTFVMIYFSIYQQEYDEEQIDFAKENWFLLILFRNLYCRMLIAKICKCIKISEWKTKDSHDLLISTRKKSQVNFNIYFLDLFSYSLEIRMFT